MARFSIGENERLIGMVTDRDITVRAVANGTDVSGLMAKDIMTKGIVWCRDADDVSHAANIMQSEQIRRLPVIDKNRRMVGILSLGDLSHAATERTTAAVTRAVSANRRSTARKKFVSRQVRGRWASRTAQEVVGEDSHQIAPVSPRNFGSSGVGCEIVNLRAHRDSRAPA